MKLRYGPVHCWAALRHPFEHSNSTNFGYQHPITFGHPKWIRIASNGNPKKWMIVRYCKHCKLKADQIFGPVGSLRFVKYPYRDTCRQMHWQDVFWLWVRYSIINVPSISLATICQPRFCSTSTAKELNLWFWTGPCATSTMWLSPWGQPSVQQQLAGYCGHRSVHQGRPQRLVWNMWGIHSYPINSKPGRSGAIRALHVQDVLCTGSSRGWSTTLDPHCTSV